jgi:hypothetical protein
MSHIIFTEVDPNEVELQLSDKANRYLADTVASDEPEPIDILIDVEEFLIEQYGITYVQACKLGVFDR